MEKLPIQLLETEPPQVAGNAEVACAGSGQVVQLFERREGVVPPLSREELREWRRIRPQLLVMLSEWQRVRGGCPLAVKLLDGDT